MRLALPRIDQREAYSRLSTLYAAVFAIAGISFYASALDGAYDSTVAVVACTSAAIHYALLRLVRGLQPVIQHKAFKAATVLTSTDLLASVDQLRRSARGGDEIGLMLISLSAGDQGREAPASLRKLVQGELFRAADSRIFELDSSTLAIAECHNDVAMHFDRIVRALQRDIQAWRPVTSDAVTAHATIGVAFTDNTSLPPASLLDAAQTAVRLATLNGRESFFRRV
ncbi:MAG TPA: hypothetical protein VNN21_10175 [Dehalococcoidia bacterium]|nr:hypothetical protein [Dehalococcoidia bacterium]